jgi:hypothetical protein
MFTQMKPAKVSHLSSAGVTFEKVLFVGRKLKHAVGQKRPAVVAADKPPWVAALGFIHQRIATVLAHVVEGLNTAVLLAHHQDFFATHRLHLPVTGLG